jgi:hypothetical protein
LLIKDRDELNTENFRYLKSTKKGKIMCTRNLAKVRAKNLKDDANRVLNYLSKGDIRTAKLFLTDMKEGINLIESCK